MNIGTERLQPAHLPILEHWIGRAEGRVTPGDFPQKKDDLTEWFDMCTQDPGRKDYLILAYETPVGLAGLRKRSEKEKTAELYLLLGERNYNLLRTATYAVLPMLDRAFLDLGFDRAVVRVYQNQRWFLTPLEQMGFTQMGEENGLITLSVEKKEFLQRKYLF